MTAKTYLESIFSEPIRHKVFVSYHHSNDEIYKYYFTNLFGKILNGFISKSVELGDINPRYNTEFIRNKIRDEFIREATVVVVLIGNETWKRKHIDWEISGALRKTRLNSRCGLLGIVLPTHPDFSITHPTESLYPPRFVDNVKCGYARMIRWTENPQTIQNEIEIAYTNRTKKNPDNSYPNYTYNRS